MKGAFIKILAVLLTIWYSMSIIGFDVHTCKGSGRSFVTTFVEGMSCEEIHPEHGCTPLECCSHEHGSSCCHDHSHIPTQGSLAFSAGSCCSSDYQVLEITGAFAEDNSRTSDESAGLVAANVILDADTINIPVSSWKYEPFRRRPDLGYGAKSGVLSALCVWRI